ncbi:MAG: hypothetical protein PWR13_1083 [Archaeoglobi archaeon]|nr:hypothetical protein [Archaeoglobi archaeon]
MEQKNQTRQPQNNNSTPGIKNLSLRLTKPSEFEKFLKRHPEGVDLILIPLKPGSKTPYVNSSIKDRIEDIRLTPEEATECLSKGLNLAIYGSPHGLCFVDIDRPDLVDPGEFPETFTVKTRNGGYQLYYRNTGIERNYILKKNGEKIGELRANWQYVVAPGSYVPPDEEAYPGATGLYEVVRDVDIKSLSLVDIHRFIENGRGSVEKGNTTQTVDKRTGEFKNKFGISLKTILQVDKKLEELLSDLNPGYPSRSEADMATIDKLYFWGFDENQIVEILREYRDYEKTERDDYLEYTIKKAVESFSGETFDPVRYPSLWLTLSVLETGGRVDNSDDDPENIWNIEIPPLELNLPEDNFIMKYIEMAKRRTDAYLEYHFAGALAILSRIADKKIYVDFAHETVYPNLWIWTLGDSTLSRKSTAFRIAKNLVKISDLDIDFFLPHSFSPEAFIEILSEQEHGALWLDEAGSLLSSMEKPYMVDLRDLFCRLYDNEPYHRKLRTSKSGSKKSEFKVDDPYFTQWLATTPDVFKAHTTTLDLTSGWLLRYIYLVPDYEKERRGFRLTTDEDVALSNEVSSHLREIHEKIQSLPPTGVGFEPDALVYFQAWQDKREEEAIEKKDRILTQLLGRYYTIAVKLAMLFELGSRDFSFRIRYDSIKEACRVVDTYLLPYAVKIIQELEWDEKTNLQERILGELRRAGGELTRRELQRRLHRRLDEVEEALKALEFSGEVEIVIIQTKGGPTQIIRLKKKRNGTPFTPVEIPEEELAELRELFSHKNGEKKDPQTEDTETPKEKRGGLDKYSLGATWEENSKVLDRFLSSPDAGELRKSVLWALKKGRVDLASDIFTRGIRNRLYTHDPSVIPFLNLLNGDRERNFEKLKADARAFFEVNKNRILENFGGD